ncbi:MAG: DUF4157 domain-containing protein [Cyanobacteria bacterium CRU_2_1]|nr:DUF4157 domain-containing protein [Cyanobacteria bacterium CRU_2_1]
MPAFESDEPIVQRQAIAKSTGITPTAVTLQSQGEADELKLLEEQPEEFPQVQRLPALASADNPDDEAEPVLQFSLTIGQPGDAYEREADAMADRVVAISKSRSRTPSALQAKPLAPSIARLKRRSNRQIQAKCAVCQTTEDLVPRLQRKPSLLTQRNSSLSPRPEVSARLQRAKGSGSRLDDPTRSRMEAAFGSDFSRVRIHTGSEAIQLSQDLGAQAFTHGSDIYFNAGQYNPTARDGEHLLAHELTHTVQQGASPTPADDRPPPPNLSTATPPDLQPGFLDDVEELWDDATDAVEEAGDAIGDAAESAYEAVAEVGEEAYEIAAEIGEEAYETAVEVGETLYEAGGVVVDVASDIASEVVDFWLSTPAGQLAQRIASALDGLISISSAGIEINIPRVCPIDALLFRFNLPSIGGKYMVPIFRLPIGPDVFISGDIGVAGSITPEAQIQLGPICLNGLHLLLNPFTDTYSISGSLSATLGAALGAEVRGGVRGELGLEAIVPIGGVPVPISVPLIGLEGGLAGMVRGIGGTTLTIGGGFSLGGGVVSLDQYRQLDFGLGADLFLGAYGQLDIAGTNVCRIYWQPLEWHGDIAASLGISAGLTIIPGATPLILPRVDPPTLQEIPFDQIPLIVSRGGFSDQCPIIDQLCDVLRELNLLPSQNGGKWNWAGPHGPGKRLLGPLEVYEKTPPIASKSECRGACGPNCDTCEPYPVYYFTDPVTGVIWEYTNFQDCNSNDGCREHDAAFDWAAAEKGETGRWDIVMPWHMAANLECACNNLAGNCIAWIVGLPPYDRKMFFADTAKVSTGRRLPGGPGGPQPLSLDEARRVVQESSRRIAELVRQRPDPQLDPEGAARIDRLIAEIQREREDALVQVVLAENPLIEIVDRARGIYRVPVTDAQGNTQYVYGSILVVWHLGEISPTTFAIQAQIRAHPTEPGVTARLGVAGTSVQGRVQPFPGDIDFVEEIDIVAATDIEAGRALARTVIEFVSRNARNPRLEFLRMIIMYHESRSAQWTEADVNAASRNNTVFERMATQLSVVDRNINTFWRVLMEEGRFIDVTKVLSVRATTAAGEELFSTPRRSDLSVAYLEEPPEIPSGSLGDFAAAMRDAAIELADDGKYLKAAKRAYNFFTVTGNLEAMQRLEPVFRSEQARVNQQASVLETIARTLSERSSPTRVLMVEEARQQLGTAADIIATSLPEAIGVTPRPAEIADEIRILSHQLRGNNSGLLLRNNAQSRKLNSLLSSTGKHINSGLKDAVSPIIETYLR